MQRGSITACAFLFTAPRPFSLSQSPLSAGGDHFTLRACARCNGHAPAAWPVVVAAILSAFVGFFRLWEGACAEDVAGRHASIGQSMHGRVPEED